MPLSYYRPADAPDAARALAAPGAMPLGGGTDLVVTFREGLERPEAMVDLTRLPGLAGVNRTADGGLELGGATRLADIEGHADVRTLAPVLAAACHAVGTVQLRQMGTLGGNLAQRPRCWYFRRHVPCAKSGGTGCPALEGEGQHLGIFGDGPCHAPHPGDVAVALAALDAELVIATADGTRTTDVAGFFAQPDPTRETTLARGEYVRAVRLPAAALGGPQHWEKLMQRGAWDFAMVSHAAVRRADGDVRLVLGGVAAAPWRAGSSIEEDVASGGLDDDTIATLAERALYDARPTARTQYKVAQAQALLVRGIRAVAP
jgi:xanthine dehydrogenase YagS FAD-binding subunit